MNEINTGSFLCRLLNAYNGNIASEAENIHFAMTHGFAEALDELSADKPLIRSQAARIIHDFLKKELHEPDEPDWGDAGRLKDLYDCHVCVNHIAQVCVKGIMSPKHTDNGDIYFDGKGTVSETEADEIINNIFILDQRTEIYK